MLNEFTYTLVSDVDQGGNFINSCNEILDFQTIPYEVCMQEMLLTVGAWDNVRDGTNHCVLKGKHQLQPLVLSIKPNHYPTISALLDGINNAIKEANDMYRVVPSGDAATDARLNAAVGWNGHFVHDETQKTIEFKLDPNEPMGTGSETTIKFGKEMSFMLGLVDAINMPLPTIKIGDKIDTKLLDLYRNTLTILWVQADFIEPTIVGEDLIPILRMVPIQLTTGSMEHSMFGLQYYSKVKRRMIREFGITFKEVLDGPPIRIRGTVVINLAFKHLE
jgi:hypothetical protein